MRRELDPTRKDEERYGNNAAFTCPICGRVFLVSGLLREPGGEPGERRCPGPGCGKSVARIQGTVATIEWQE